MTVEQQSGGAKKTSLEWPNDAHSRSIDNLLALERNLPVLNRDIR
jgi:hypothetical protein